MPYKRINLAMLLAMTAMAAAGCGPHPDGTVRMGEAKRAEAARQASLTDEQKKFEAYRSCVGISNDQLVSAQCQKDTGYGQ